MNVVYFTAGETYKALRVVPKRRSDCASLPSFSGSTATFTLWDNEDRTAKLLDGVAAVVELNADNSLLAVRFEWTAGHWSTVSAAKGGEPSGSGYRGRFEVATSGGDTVMFPEQEGFVAIPIHILPA